MRSVDPTAELSLVDGDEVYAGAEEMIVATDTVQVLGCQAGFLRGGPRN